MATDKDKGIERLEEDARDRGLRGGYAVNGESACLCEGIITVLTTTASRVTWCAGLVADHGQHG